MKRLNTRVELLVIVCALTVCLLVSGAAPARSGMDAPLRTSVSSSLSLPREAEGWADSYLSFLEGSYDIFMALWPEGISGMGFIDLDLDGTPELIVFDQGAASTLGVQLFDLIDGQVCCVSSVLDSAPGAFGGEHASSVSVCANYFESFRLSRTEAGWCFWVNSANSTMETAWDEIVRFDSVNGVLTPSVICARYLESDPNTGMAVSEQYSASGSAVDAAAYQAAADIYFQGEDAGYNGAGVFLWNNMNAYTAPYDGFMAMARDAVAAYVPIASTVTVATVH